MERMNVMEEEFEAVEFMGQQALFTEARVDKATVPKGIYCYELRHSDEDDRIPVTVEKKVTVNYFGAVLLTRELPLKEGFLSLTPNNLGFTGEQMTVDEFILGLRIFEEGEDLADWLAPTFTISAKEAALLLKYLISYDCAIAQKDNKIFLCEGKGEWKECSIDDLIEMICDWNHSSIQLLKDHSDTNKEYYHNLLEDKKFLDSLFARTKHGELKKVQHKEDNE